ncbi:MAG: hypothetical protein ACI4SD_01475 [Suilimivivens sp.]
MKKRRLFAPFLMLLAALVASVVMFRGDYDTTEMLAILLLVMVFFYAAGSFIQKKITSFMDQIREKERIEAENEGEVIEKVVSAPDGESLENRENV